jgi:hypothetical protein
VFVSSTYLDLQEERQEVIQALLELDCFPAGMELFPASNDERWELIKSVIDDSDFYVVIIGGRYGSVDDQGISYTEREYDYAAQSKKPVLGFLHAEPGDIPHKYSDIDPNLQTKLAAFRAKVGQRMCKMWTSPAELGSVVSRSLIKSIKSTAAEGWVRAGNALTSEHLEEVARLRQLVAEFELERERTRTSAPKGTEEFAQGTDSVELAYQFFRYEDNFDLSGAPCRGTVELTWDQTFRAVGPLMFDEANESAMRDRLSRAAREAAEQANDWPGGVVSKFEVIPATFDQVKVQLVALRLIEKSDRRKGINDRNTYWRLTPYGETYTMSLLAARRGERATASLEPSDVSDPDSE